MLGIVWGKADRMFVVLVRGIIRIKGGLIIIIIIIVHRCRLLEPVTKEKH
jgi:hypothetical protein